MSFRGVVLYGPPASGKDTVTIALCELDARFTMFRRLRVSATPKAGYRSISASNADSLASQGEVVYENSRYGNRYIVDRAEIERLTAAELVPVLHLGQIAGVRAVQAYGSWLAVSLNCSRETTLSRARARGDADVSDRLEAWDQTAADVAAHSDFRFDLVIDSEAITPSEAAAEISHHFEHRSVASANSLSGE